MHELNTLRESHLEGEIDRGTFLRRALALGFSLSAAGALFAAWGRATADASIGATPKRGGVLKFARNFEPVTLGPFGAADNGTIWTIMMIYDQLVEYAPGKLDPAPGLAKSWEFSNGGKTIVFHLRDAKFSNGSPVTADDVVFSLNRFKDAKGQQPPAVPRDEHRLGHGHEPEDGRHEAEAPRRSHPLEPLGFPGLDHAQGGRDEDGRQGVRAEPRRERPLRGQRLEAWPVPQDGPEPEHYWRSGQPYLDSIKFDYITNDNTRILSLQSGQVDVAESIPFSRSTRSTRAQRASRSRRSRRSTRSGSTTRTSRSTTSSSARH